MGDTRLTSTHASHHGPSITFPSSQQMREHSQCLLSRSYMHIICNDAQKRAHTEKVPAVTHTNESLKTVHLTAVSEIHLPIGKPISSIWSVLTTDLSCSAYCRYITERLLYTIGFYKAVFLKDKPGSGLPLQPHPSA